MADSKYGVINEQGYPAGQFGFVPVNESEKKNIEDSEKEESKMKKEEKE